ncbi:MAG TPA: uroporphyrinogen decarboxylase family protein [Capsulimonadaceae bacterium]
MTMTPRENFLRIARRDNPEWMTMDFGVSRGGMAMFREHLGADVDIVAHFKYDGRWVGPTGGTRRPEPDWRMLYYPDGSLPDEARIDSEWGTAQVYHAESDDAISFAPLRDIATVADLDAYPWPDDVGAAHRFAGMRERVDAAHAEGMPVYGGGLNFFESLWGLCGFETLLLGMACDEPWARKLYAKHAEGLIQTAEQIAMSGADILQTGSDVATQIAPMMSTRMWRNWIFPLMRDSIAAAKRINPDILAFYHSDGNVEPLIEGFIEAGVDILDPIQPECMDIFAAKKKYGDRISFHGGIGVQTTLPFGTPTEVRDTVRRTIDALSAGGGGYFCAPAHMIRPEVPWANVMAFVETIREYGHP